MNTGLLGLVFCSFKDDRSSRGGDVGLRTGAERTDADSWGLCQGVAQTVWCGMGVRAGRLCRHATHPGRLTRPKADGVAGMDVLMRLMHGWIGGETGWWTR